MTKETTPEDILAEEERAWTDAELAKLDGRVRAQYFHTFPEAFGAVCCLVLKNGFCIVGEAFAVRPESYDEQTVKMIAKDRALAKIVGAAAGEKTAVEFADEQAAKDMAWLKSWVEKQKSAADPTSGEASA